MPIIQQNGFDDPRNYDDVFGRSVLAGLLSVLSDKVNIFNITDKGRELVNIPFFPSMSGDSRFMQDFFFFGQKCIYPKLADGNYDAIPRGIATRTSSSINQSALTHRFIRATYVKNVDGEIQEFNAYTNSIPVNFTFEIELHTRTYLDLLKAEQAIVEVFYKTQIYSIFYKGFKVPAQVGFPEDYGSDHLFEYSFPEGQPNKLVFPLEISTYQPVIDETSVIANNKRILYFSGIRDVDDTLIRMLDDNPTITYPGSDLPIKWETTGDVLDVNITYRIENDLTEYKIDTDRPNNGLLIWKVPTINETASVYLLDIGYYVHREALLHPQFNSVGELIDIIIIDGGIGYDEGTLVEIDETGFKGTQAKAMPLLLNGTIVSFTIIDGGNGYKPTISTDITIQVQSARHKKVLAEWNTITIQ